MKKSLRWGFNDSSALMIQAALVEKQFEKNWISNIFQHSSIQSSTYVEQIGAATDKQLRFQV